MSPPGFTSNNRISPAGGRREQKAAWRADCRDLLTQCERCHCTGTARVHRSRGIISTNLAARSGRVWRHADCGGALVVFDIAVSDA